MVTGCMVTRGGAITAARFGQQRSSKEQHADQHAGKARFKGGDRAHMAPAAIKEQHADQHARKARIRGFMGSYGVTLFSRPSAYIYPCTSSHGD